MAVYLESIITEYHDGSDWVDISAYVVGDIKGSNGLGGWKPDQRVATLGILNITLNNKGKLFSPMGGDAVRGLSTLTGFNKGAKIRVRGVYDTFSYTIWIGRIESIDSDDLNWGNEQVRLMAVDYMKVPTNYPMQGATIALNKRIDEAMTLILARLSLQPEDTDFDTGSFTFPAVFDNVQRKTMALSEFTKLANSELGYIYVTQDGTLVAENMLARNGWRELDQVWIIPDAEYFLLKEDGDFLLLETGDKIILDEGEFEDASINATVENHNILLAEDSLLNASIIRAHPVITDTSLKVLYKLGTPVFIPSGNTYQFSAHYTDPNGLSQVSGTNMQAPVATTDYLANSQSGGGGSNETANITVTATYYGDTVYYSILNSASVGIYVTFLQARGYGIYYGNSIESTIDDDASQSAYGYAPFQFDQKYQKDAYLANMYGLSVIVEYKDPKSRITQMKFLANLNNNHMMSFLLLTIGSLILGTEDRSNIDNHYYITDRTFTIKQGGIINVEYGVKQNDSYLSGGLEPVTVEFDGGSTDAVNYGYLPHASNLTTRTISAWIYADTDPTGTNKNTILSALVTGNGWWLYTFTGNKISFYQGHNAGDDGEWRAQTNSISLGAWHHIVVTSNWSPVTSAPIIYVNGVVQTLTVIQTPANAVGSETGSRIIVGNVNNPAFAYNKAWDGKIFDPRVYNRVLTPTEVTTLYNGGNPDHTLVTDGLVFQGLAVYSDLGDDASLAGTVLSSTDRLTENILRAVGIPNASPTIRANP